MIHSDCQLIIGLESGNEAISHARAIPEARRIDNRQHVRSLCFGGIIMPYSDKEKEREYHKKYSLLHPEVRRKAWQKYQLAHPEKIREKSRNYYKQHSEEIRQKASEYKKANPEFHRRAAKKYRKVNPEKIYAHNIANHHIPLKPFCEICGIVAEERHHPDYSQPRHVMHLCKICHRKISAIEKARERKE